MYLSIRELPIDGWGFYRVAKTGKNTGWVVKALRRIWCIYARESIVFSAGIKKYSEAFPEDLHQCVPSGCIVEMIGLKLPTLNSYCLCRAAVALDSTPGS